MKIYVVIGSAGEYSDRTEWPVCAYTSENDAKLHVTKADEYSRAWEALSCTEQVQELDWSEFEKIKKTSNPMDPNFGGYTGTSYDYSEVELLDHFTSPEVLQ